MSPSIVEESLVKGRYERGALPAGCQVTAPEIAHYSNSCPFGEQSRVADLNAKSPTRLMAHCLAMAAYGANLRRLQTLLVENGQYALGGDLYPLLFGDGRSGQLIGA